MPEPQYTFSLPESAYAELAALAKHAQILSDFTEYVADVQQVSLKEAVVKASKKTALTQDESRRIIRALLNLHSLVAHLEKDPADVVSAVTSTLELKASESWKKANLEAWNNATDSIVKVLSEIGPDSALAVTGKARAIERSHENGYVDSRIFTTLRPVFNRDGDAIQKMIVFNELVLTIVSGGSPQTLQIALDASDIIELKKQCERAQLKSATVQKSLSELPWQTYISNDPEND